MAYRVADLSTYRADRFPREPETGRVSANGRPCRCVRRGRPFRLSGARQRQCCVSRKTTGNAVWLSPAARLNKTAEAGHTPLSVTHERGKKHAGTHVFAFWPRWSGWGSAYGAGAYRTSARKRYCGEESGARRKRSRAQTPGKHVTSRDVHRQDGGRRAAGGIFENEHRRPLFIMSDSQLTGYQSQ